MGSVPWESFIQAYLEKLQPIWQNLALSEDDPILHGLKYLLCEDQSRVTLESLGRMAHFMGEGAQIFEPLLDLCQTRHAYILPILSDILVQQVLLQNK